MKRLLCSLILVFSLSPIFAQDYTERDLQLVNAINFEDYENIFSLCNYGATLVNLDEHIINSINYEKFEKAFSKAHDLQEYQTIIALNLFRYFNTDILDKTTILEELYDSHMKIYNNNSALPDTLTFIYSLGNTVGVLFEQKIYDKTMQLLNITEKISKQFWGEYSFDYAMTLDAWGYLNETLGDTTSAIVIYEKKNNILQIVLGEQSEEYAISLKNLGSLYYQLGDYLTAEKYFIQAASILKKVVRGYDSNNATSLYNLGMLYDDQNDYSKAEKYYIEAYHIAKEVWGMNSPNTYTVLNNLGLLYKRLGNDYQNNSDYNRSEEYYLRALKIWEWFGRRNPDYATILHSLGKLYNKTGDYLKAEDYLNKSLSIQKEVLGENHREYFATLNSLAILYHYLKNYIMAEETYLQLLKHHSEISKEDYATLLTNIGSLYDEMGEYKKAEEYFLQGLIIRKNILGDQHADYASSLYNLSVLYINMANFRTAEELLLQASSIYKETLGEHHLTYARCLGRLGLLYFTMGNLPKSLESHLASLNIIKDILPEDTYDYAASLNNIGMTYSQLKKYKKAEEFLLQAFAIHAKLNSTSIGYWYTLNNLRDNYDDQGNFSESYPLSLKIFELGKQEVNKNFEFMSEHQRESYWEKHSFQYAKITPSFCYKNYLRHNETSKLAYDNALFSKGLLLNTSSQIQHSILESGDTALIAQWDALQSIKKRIIFLEQKTLEEQKQMGIDSLYTKAEQLEKQVIANSKEYRNAQDAWKISWNNVRDKLGKNDVAIEFISFDYYNRGHFTDSTMYCALVLRKGYKQPIMVPLFEEKEIIQLVNDKPDMVYSDWGNGELLYQKIWQPLCQYINPNDNVYFAASGLLHQLNIGALPVGNEKTIDDIYHLNRVSSTRSLAMPDESIQETSATLYGGILYDVSNTDLQAESKQYVLNTNHHASRSIEVDSTTRAGVKYLAGTEKEVEEINTLLKKNKLSIQLYTSQSANEESFKALSGKKQNILHIATHGFFWPIEKAKDKDLFRHMQLSNESSLGQYIDPLTRCGLLFAGANTALKGNADSLPSGVDDGILTAKEISLIDLRNADLVVLSACETGKGEITSEGVFGLQRAFKQAGAQTMVMSLWEVSDDATQMFMTLFYQNMMKGLSKQEAFNAAQQSVREQRPEPYYWAAFVLLDGK